MKYVVPVHKFNGCVHLGDESKIAASFDEFGVRPLFCVEDGPLDTFESLEFDTKEAMEAYLESR